MIMAKSRKPGPRKFVRRSEITGSRFQAAQEIWNRQTVLEIDPWLLRAGLSPQAESQCFRHARGNLKFRSSQANRPMSEIGIYTDFT